MVDPFFVVSVFFHVFFSVKTIGIICRSFFCLRAESRDFFTLVEEDIFVCFFIPEMTLNGY